MSPTIPPDQAAIRWALSIPRTDTYINAAGGDPARAVALYGWNARVSAALMLPAHFAEVTTRNAVSDALTILYGSRWPWNPTFRQSLPTPGGRPFNPRRNLIETANRHGSTGKIIAELKFAFWQAMFTARHDERVWSSNILEAFPAAAGLTALQLRTRIHDDLDIIRQLRNRIAHHEPIIARALPGDLDRMLELIQLRSPATASWVRELEEVTSLLALRP